VIWTPAFAGVHGDWEMARQVLAGMRRDGGPLGFWVYIMANKRNGTTYVGSTDDLAHRVHQHRRGTGSDHTRKYGCETSSGPNGTRPAPAPSSASGASRNGTAPGSFA
jgi:hypothetical protein